VKLFSALGERFREGLKRSQEYLSGGLGAVLETDRPIDDALLEELEELLIAADLGAMIAADFDPVMASRKKVTVWYAFWGEARWRPEYLKICQSLSESYFTETRSLCREIVEFGGYPGIDPDTVARGLNAMIDGLWLDILTSPTAVDRKEAKRTCLGLLAAVFPREFADHLAASRAA